jgi:uncharacterized protein with von Willebrand factor type A (vWA) domain
MVDTLIETAQLAIRRHPPKRNGVALVTTMDCGGAMVPVVRGVGHW